MEETMVAKPTTLASSASPTLSRTNTEKVALAARSWCLSMPGTTREKLMANIQYACGGGIADCRAIQEDGPCYSTDIIKVANYAMNAYYYATGHEALNCYFDGTGRIVYDDPTYDSCVYH
ncbi:glucan endo-1,3-beta-glucosidase-like [Zingiber officinale]|uniref:glucan endo-1,3-beta-glucosidase-like n=1 Tax=Zingiber officinale TaxID=94328 RepID=UPI001C4DD89F|nr:glucan endo-1,3-beta-glucosidase-like [Zingiber officinale]